MKIAGQLMLPDQGQRVRLAPGWVCVENGAVAQVVEGDIPSDADLGGEGFVICPGFIDAHVHLPQFGIIGNHGLALLDWLERVTFPAELRWEDPDVARQDTQRAVRRMLRCGTTGFAAYTTVHGEGTRAALETAGRMGVRAWIGQVLMDRGAPPGLCRPAGQLLDEAAQTLERHPAAAGDGGPPARVAAAVTPRFAPACSPGLLRGAGRLAEQYPALVQTHLAETRAECALVAEQNDGQRYLDVYRSAGLVGPRSVFGHGIYIDPDDRTALAASGSAVAHCPTANSFLMSGRMDWAGALGLGLRVALGSDIGAGYEVSMVRVARAMLETAGTLRIDDPRRASGTVPDASHAWWQITAGNAAALHWCDAGAIAPGRPADLVLVRPTPDLGLSAVQDPLAAMLFGWDDRWVERVLLAGSVVEL